MEEYIVSALKYRPLSFDSVVGQRSLTTTLKNAISTNKLAHAYLFCGPRGVGKTTCARIFAKAINCLNPRDGGDACGACESCLAFDQQRSMNIHELDAASNNSVEDIRELCKQVLIPPQIGRYKVFIIDEVHMLSSAAFNAFLKTLEEPPSYVIFILATTEKHKILPTILSRCQVYDFQRMTTEDTARHLMYVAEKEGYTAEAEALALIAEKADGGMRDALSIFDQMVSFSGGNLTYEVVCKNLNVLSLEYYFKLTDLILAHQIPQSLLLFSEVLQKGFDAGNFIGGMASHLRNLLVAHDDVTLPLLEMSEKMRSRYQEQATRCPVRFIYKALKLTNDCDQAYRTSHNKRLQVELCLIQCAQATETGDEESNGPGPAASLKPTFSAAAAPTTDVTAKPASNSDTMPQAQPAGMPVKKETTATRTTAPETSPQALDKEQTGGAAIPDKAEKEDRKLPKVSFKRFGASKNVKEAEPVQEAPAVLPQKEPVTSEKLSAAWFAFIASLPHESTALAQRLRGLMPTVTDANTATLTVSNPQAQQAVEALMPQILSVMRSSLNNTEFRIITALEEIKEVTKAYSTNDMLKMMAQDNPNVSDLVTRLHLKYD